MSWLGSLIPGVNYNSTKVFDGVEPHRGVFFFLFSKSHGAVRCGVFFWGGIVWCRGEVRCGFHFFKMIGCGAVRFFSLTVRRGIYIFKNCTVLCGYPLNSWFLPRG